MFRVKAAAKSLLREWSEAQVQKGGVTGQAVGARIWNRPMARWLKVNVDAAVFQGGSIGVGCVVHDSQGAFV